MIRLGKKFIYEIFRQADTPDWRKTFAFALPIIGIHDWEEVNPGRKQPQPPLSEVGSAPNGFRWNH